MRRGLSRGCAGSVWLAASRALASATACRAPSSLSSSARCVSGMVTWSRRASAAREIERLQLYQAFKIGVHVADFTTSTKDDGPKDEA